MRTSRVIALGNARLGSHRCPRKMIRPFCGTTLTRLALERLDRLRGFDGVYFAAYEPELQAIAADFEHVTLIHRSRESAEACNPITKVHDYLHGLDCDYVFWINSCLPLLRAETIEHALERFRANPSIRSLTAVVRSHNWFYTLGGAPINNLDPRCIDTKLTPAVYEVCHAFHCFSREHLLSTESYWNNRPDDPHLVEIDPAETVDVDTELDFTVAEGIYSARMGCVSA